MKRKKATIGLAAFMLAALIMQTPAGNGTALLQTQAAASVAKVKDLTAARSSVKKVKLKWEKVSKASGYQVYMKKGGGKYKRIKTVSSKKSTYTYTKLSGKSKYKFKVRAYKKNGSSRKYGKFSSAVNVKKVATKAKLSSFTSDISSAQVNKKENVVFTVKVKANGYVKNNTVKLYRGKERVAYMNDNGKNGDAVMGDGIFTAKINVKSSTKTQQKYSASCFSAKSKELTFRFFSEPTGEDGDQLFKTAKELEKLDNKYTVSGAVPDNKIAAALNTVYDRVKQLKSDGVIVDAHKNDNNIWMQFSSGLQYVYMPQTADKDAGSGKSAIITCQPFKNWYRANRDAETASLDTAGTDSAANKIKQKLSNYTFSGDYDNNNVTLDTIKNFSSNQVILWHGHGGYDKSKGSFIVTGEELNTTRFLWDPVYYLGNKKYTGDYLSGRIILTNYNQLGINAAFVNKYCGSMNGTFVYLAACESGKSSVLANSFISKGAAAVIGNTESIITKYNSRMERDVVNGLLSISSSTGTYKTLKEALAQAKKINGKNDGGNPAAEAKIFGSETYRLSSSKTGTLDGLVMSAKDNSSLKGVTVDLYKKNKKIASAKTDSKGKYKFKKAHGDYTIQIKHKGYKAFTNNVTLVTGEVTYVENILLVDNTSQKGTASGTIVDATTGKALAGVKITAYQGWNNTSSKAVGSIKTDSNGKYSFEQTAGYYTLKLSKSGYTATTINVIIQNGNTGSQNGIMNPKGSKETYRIVLSWGANPRDLDSHLTGKRSDGRSFHIYFGSKTASENGEVIAKLDVDDTSGYGPETTTLLQTSESPYYYYVYKYAGYGDLSGSGAQVKLYKGNKLIKIYNVPTSGSGRYWNIFKITNGVITDMNEISSLDTTY